MIEVTSEIHGCREAVRHLWNSHFVRLLGRVPDGEVIDLFEQATEVIFNALVLHACCISDPASNLNCAPFPSLLVVPETQSAGRVLINRDLSPSGYWDGAPQQLTLSATTFELIGFFDWDQFGYIDLRFLRTRISDCAERPDLIGRDALIDVGYAKVFCRTAD